MSLHSRSVAHLRVEVHPDFDRGQVRPDNQNGAAAVLAPKSKTVPTVATGQDFDRGHDEAETHMTTAAVPVPTTSPSVPKYETSGQGSSPVEAMPASFTTRNALLPEDSNRSQTGDDAHNDLAAVRVEASASPASMPAALRPEDLLLICSDTLDDLEHMRMALANRIGAMQRIKGLEGSAEEARLLGMLDGIKAIEHGAELELKRALRKHPLGPWVKRTVGVGEKQAARLLGTIGNPYWHPGTINRETGEVTREPGPRTVSELWAYCGYHVLPAHCERETQPKVGGGSSESNPSQASCETQKMLAGIAPRRAKGKRANWNGQARSRCFLIAESCIKQMHSPYRKVYDDGRAKYADAIHAVACVQCGTKGKPAAPGTELRDGHKHARALRLVSKAVLRDLWLEAKTHLHSESNPQPVEASSQEESNG